MSTLTLTPFTIEVDGYFVDVLEVIKHTLPNGEVMYTVVVRVRGNGVKSRVFSLDVKSERELKAKLLIEISKLKFMRILMGESYVREVIEK